MTASVDLSVDSLLLFDPVQPVTLVARRMAASSSSSSSSSEDEDDRKRKRSSEDDRAERKRRKKEKKERKKEKKERKKEKKKEKKKKEKKRERGGGASGGDAYGGGPVDEEAQFAEEFRAAVQGNKKGIDVEAQSAALNEVVRRARNPGAKPDAMPTPNEETLLRVQHERRPLGRATPV